MLTAGLLVSGLLGVVAGLQVELEDIGEVELEEGVAVLVQGGTEVTMLKAAKKCIRRAAPGDVLSVHYTGRFSGPEGAVFDTSRKSPPRPFGFRLGAGGVIAGYEKGVPGMCKGEVRGLLVPPGMAYGERGAGPIPGGATLHFTVELLSIQDGPPAPKDQRMCYSRGEMVACASLNSQDL